MKLSHKIANFVGVFVPFAAFVAAIPLLWCNGLQPRDLVILGVAYVFTCLGISIGFHRLLTHRAYQTYPAIRYTLAVLGSLAVQGPAIRWVADHRKHHNFADKEGDPHSPHVGRGSGVLGAIGGLWHAHVGWLFENVGGADERRYTKDLLADRGLVWISRLFLPLIALSLALPFAAGWAWGGTLGAGLEALLWGGLVRIFFVHHVTWSVNSVCHFFGSRRFDTDDHSTNVFWLALPSLGESWHHNHHAFPRSATHGLRRREIDPSAAIIAAMEKLGLARNVIRISEERQAQKVV